MTVQEAYTFVADRINKHNSNSGQNYSERQFTWAYNMAIHFWFDLRIKLDSMDKVRQNELQQFIEEICIHPSNAESCEENYYYINLPEDYYYYERSYAYSSKGDCEHIVYGLPVEEGSINQLLIDSFQKPSFEWQESFYTIGDNKLKFFKSDFTINKIFLSYYKCPKELDFNNMDEEIELKKSNLYEVLNLTSLILSGDIKDGASFKTISNYLQQFN